MIIFRDNFKDLMPLLSIITITYNAEEFIERTLKSIINQSNQDFEYIIIDGASKDMTLKIVRKYKKRVDVLVSEPDNGLYDAMNKGQNIASGKYVWFMNAGDEICGSDIVDKLLEILKYDPDVVYSDTYLIDNDAKILGLRSDILPHKVPRKLTWQQYNLGMLVCHQSFVAKKALTSSYVYHNLSADIDWEIKVLKKASGAVVMFSGILSKYLIGGISNQKKWKSLKDRYTVLQNHFGFLPNLLNHLKIVWRGLVS